VAAGRPRRLVPVLRRPGGGGESAKVSSFDAFDILDEADEELTV
jgi:hypothetical protein